MTARAIVVSGRIELPPAPAPDVPPPARRADKEWAYVTPAEARDAEALPGLEAPEEVMGVVEAVARSQQAARLAAEQLYAAVRPRWEAIPTAVGAPAEIAIRPDADSIRIPFVEAAVAYSDGPARLQPYGYVLVDGLQPGERRRVALPNGRVLYVTRPAGPDRSR